jgi:hypothetical protein
MAHYAFIDNNDIVTEVIVGIDEDSTDTLPEGYTSWEDWYLTQRPSMSACKRTSYNTIANTHSGGGTAFRGNYAGIGFTWDETNDVFYPPQPYGSWTLSSDWVWEAPIDYPDDGNNYIWNENAYQADTADPKTEGWELQA